MRSPNLTTENEMGGVDMRNPQIIETVWGVGYRFNRL